MMPSDGRHLDVSWHRPPFFGGRQKYLNARDAEPLSLVKNAGLGKRYPHARNWEGGHRNFLKTRNELQ